MDENQEVEVKSIGSMIGKLQYPEKKTKGGINSQRSYAVEQLMIFMREDPKNNTRFKYWLGRTRKITPARIFENMSRSKGSKNPQALFNWFLKKENAPN